MPLISITASKSSTRAAPPVLAAGDAIQLFVNKKSRDEKAGVKMKSVDGKLWIEEVIPGGLMEQAGAKVNDRIQFINGRPAKTPRPLRRSSTSRVHCGCGAANRVKHVIILQSFEGVTLGVVR